MEKENNIIYFEGEQYSIINSTVFLGNKYIFVINSNNIQDVKLLACLNQLEEVEDITLIQRILLQMK